MYNSSAHCSLFREYHTRALDMLSSAPSRHLLFAMAARFVWYEPSMNGRSFSRGASLCGALLLCASRSASSSACEVLYAFGAELLRVRTRAGSKLR